VENDEMGDDILFLDMGMDSLLSVEFYNKIQLHLKQLKIGFLDVDEHGAK